MKVKVKIKEMYMQERKKATQVLSIPRRTIVCVAPQEGVTELTGKGNNNFVWSGVSQGGRIFLIEKKSS